MSLGKWWRPTVAEREALPDYCFLDAVGRKYVICPRRGPRRPTCEGLLAARRRTILTGVRGELEHKAIMLAKRLGCPWARKAVAGPPRRRRRR